MWLEIGTPKLAHFKRFCRLWLIFKDFVDSDFGNLIHEEIISFRTKLAVNWKTIF